jgi:hypothetical protein
MIDLALHIIDTMAGHFDPGKFDCRYEDALRDLIKRKAAGEKITPVEHPKPKTTVNLMDALRASLAGHAKAAARGVGETASRTRCAQALGSKGPACPKRKGGGPAGTPATTTQHVQFQENPGPPKKSFQLTALRRAIAGAGWVCPARPDSATRTINFFYDFHSLRRRPRAF